MYSRWCTHHNTQVKRDHTKDDTLKMGGQEVRHPPILPHTKPLICQNLSLCGVFGVLAAIWSTFSITFGLCFWQTNVGVKAKDYAIRYISCWFELLRIQKSLSAFRAFDCNPLFVRISFTPLHWTLLCSYCIREHPKRWHRKNECHSQSFAICLPCRPCLLRGRCWLDGLSLTPSRVHLRTSGLFFINPKYKVNNLESGF